MVFPKISIDKLSVTARLDDYDQSSLSDYLNSVPYEIEYRSTSWNFMYQHQWLIKDIGMFIQTGKFENELLFRMEFNPNKLEKNFLTFYFNIVKRIKYPNVTRIDWAVDYDEDFSLYDIRQTTARKTISYKGRSGKLETLYLGSPKSDKFTRIYNKALEKRKSRILDDEQEIHVDEVLWRVEAVIKDFGIKIEKEIEKYVEHPEGGMWVEVPRKYYITGVACDGHEMAGKRIVKEYELKPEKKFIEGAVKVKKKEKVDYEDVFANPFTNIEVYKKYDGGTEGLKASEKAMLFYLEYHPEGWNELSKNSKKKYEELKYLYDWMLIDNQPSEVFEKEKNRLAQELESWLKPALDKSNYLTGFKSNIYYSLEYLKFQENEKLAK